MLDALRALNAEIVGEDGCLSIKTSVDIVAGARRVGIVGSRVYPELERIRTLVDLLHSDAYVISGGAEGVDRAATAAGLATRRPVIELKPIGADKRLWVRAAFERNELIALCSDVVVAFWDGASNGTADTIRHALRISGKCIVALPGQPPAVWVPRLAA